jgi:hypothetical protein
MYGEALPLFPEAGALPTGPAGGGVAERAARGADVTHLQPLSRKRARGMNGDLKLKGVSM